MKITNSNQINIKFKNRDHLTADNYFIYGHLHNVEYSVSLEA